ncbi:hypothetical protein HWV62_33583 [Athelia sp. TMB]|nr:hypothetical protein HWV62_33583 [Athelia sp. TMB]
MSTASKKSASSKPAAVKKTAAKATPSHPTWVDMIKECIAAHPEEARGGVSRPQIKKFVESTYKLEIGAAQNTQLSKAIATGAEKGTFSLPKGASGKVKLAPKVKADTASKEVSICSSSSLIEPYREFSYKNKPTSKAKPAVKASATKAPTKATTTKVAAAKKPAAKPTTTKAAPAKKPAAKAAAAKKPAATKAAASKPAAKSTTTKAAPAKKPTVKATTAKATTKKPVAKKVVAGKPAAAPKKKTTTPKAKAVVTGTTKAKAAAKKPAAKTAAKPSAKAAPKSTSRSRKPVPAAIENVGLEHLSTGAEDLLSASRGLLEAFRWDIVVSTVTSDPEIRANVYKSVLLNSLSLTSIYTFDILLQPLVRDQQKWFHRNVGWFYQALWLLPVVCVSLYLNSSWCGLIAKRTFMLQHGSRTAQQAPVTYTGLLTMLATSAYRVVMVFTSIVVGFALGAVPLVGPPLGFCFMCWVDA